MLIDLAQHIRHVHMRLSGNAQWTRFDPTGHSRPRKRNLGVFVRAARPSQRMFCPRTSAGRGDLPNRRSNKGGHPPPNPQVTQQQDTTPQRATMVGAHSASAATPPNRPRNNRERRQCGANASATHDGTRAWRDHVPQHDPILHVMAYPDHRRCERGLAMTRES